MAKLPHYSLCEEKLSERLPQSIRTSLYVGTLPDDSDRVQCNLLVQRAMHLIEKVRCAAHNITSISEDLCRQRILKYWPYTEVQALLPIVVRLSDTKSTDEDNLSC